MRRSTPGNIDIDELLPARIRRAESHDAKTVIAKLEPLVFERRRDRIKQVINARLQNVTVAFDSPYDPHNGAAILRSCEAFGVQSLHIVERTAKFLAAKSVARGAEKWVDVYSHDTSLSAITLLNQGGFHKVAAHPEGELLPRDLLRIPRVAIVLGNERNGISEELLASCDARVRVPMRGFIESLNVSVTGAILLAAATEGRAGDLDEINRERLYARALYFSVEHAEEVLAHVPS